MPFSRPFRALLKLSGLWAIPWTALGIVAGLIRWVVSPELASVTSLSGWLVGHVLAYGALGWISGIYLGLLFARVRRGSRGDTLAPSRVALLAALGGAAPPVLFAALGMVFGAPTVALLSLLGLGAVSAVGSVVLATSSQAAATRAALTGSQGPPRLPAT
jgi:hypothetical protein